MTALMDAIRGNRVDAVHQLITQGANVDELDANRDAPLVMAAYLGHAEIVRALLEAGAAVTAVDPSMRATALHAAAYAGRTEAARLLIQYGIDIDKQGPQNGYTALHDAIWGNHPDTARVLIEAGASLELRSHSGQTPLEFARAQSRASIVELIEGKRGSG